MGSVRPSVRLSVRFNSCLLNQLTFELFVYVWLMTTVARILKVKVIGQGQRLLPCTNGRGNAVGLTSILDQRQSSS